MIKYSSLDKVLQVVKKTMRFIQVVSLLLSRNLECAAQSEDKRILEQLENNAMALEVLKQTMRKQNE